MSTFLYCRISKIKQSIDRQKRNLKEAFPDGIIVEEAFSGTTIARPEWAKLCNRVTAGDTIAFDSVSRMSRNAEEGTETYFELYNRGITLCFLKEPYINTDVYKEKTRRQVERITGTGSEATDKLVNAVVDALQEYTTDLAKDQIRIAFEQSEKEVLDLQQQHLLIHLVQHPIASLFFIRSDLSFLIKSEYLEFIVLVKTSLVISLPFSSFRSIFSKIS